MKQVGNAGGTMRTFPPGSDEIANHGEPYFSRSGT
jgi:hypothetical protein